MFLALRIFTTEGGNFIIVIRIILIVFLYILLPFMVNKDSHYNNAIYIVPFAEALGDEPVRPKKNDLKSRTICRQTSDNWTTHTAVLDIFWRHFIWSVGPKRSLILPSYLLT